MKKCDLCNGYGILAGVAIWGEKYSKCGKCEGVGFLKESGDTEAGISGESK